MHSFTNPAAAMPQNGMQYSDRADRRSWHALLQFLDEVLR
jgi:dienelactone hydrolase